MAVKTWFRPLGATLMKDSSRVLAHVEWGWTPKAGRLTSIWIISGLEAASIKALELYPNGSDAI